MENKFLLGVWPLALKVLATCFIISAFLGYGVGLAKIYQLSHYSVDGAATYYAGDGAEEEETIKLPQSFEAMLSITHVHSFSQPLLFALLGLIFTFASWREPTKAWYLALLFGACVWSSISPWLVKYLAPEFVYGMLAAQLIIAYTFLAMGLVSLKQLWCSRCS